MSNHTSSLHDIEWCSVAVQHTQCNCIAAHTVCIAAHTMCTHDVCVHTCVDIWCVHLTHCVYLQTVCTHTMYTHMRMHERERARIEWAFHYTLHCTTHNAYARGTHDVYLHRMCTYNLCTHKVDRHNVDILCVHVMCVCTHNVMCTCSVCVHIRRVREGRMMSIYTHTHPHTYTSTHIHIHTQTRYVRMCSLRIHSVYLITHTHYVMSHKNNWGHKYEWVMSRHTYPRTWLSHVASHIPTHMNESCHVTHSHTHEWVVSRDT